MAFQYQKGAIKTRERIFIVGFREQGFNTKKVRLKPEGLFQLFVRQLAFQYQKGAIKTRPFKEQNRLLGEIISDLIGNVKPLASSTSGYP